MKTVKMAEMTVNEIQDYLKINQTIILPYGVVEQHGFHLPVDTDIRNADYSCPELARRLGCIVAPTLNYCFSGGMLEGTINVQPNTFALMMGDIIKSLVLQGFKNIIIFAGHGGSESLLHLKESLRILKWLNPELAEILILMIPFWDFSPTWVKMIEEDRNYHADDAETSLMLYWCPEMVRETRVRDAEPIGELLRDNPDNFQKITALTNNKNEIPFTKQRDEVKIGVMGTPEKATAEKGKIIFDEYIERLTRMLGSAVNEANEARNNQKFIELGNVDKILMRNMWD